MEKYLYISLVALLSMACSRTDRTHHSSKALSVKTTVVSEKTDEAISRYVGTVEAVREIPLSLQTSGRVVSIPVKNGEKVRQGQTILALDDSQSRHALQIAEATLRHAQDGYDRTAKVHDKGVVSDQKLVEIESELERAKGLFAAAQKEVDECTLTAPCDGIVSGLNTQTGQTVIPGVKLCSVLDMSGFCVRFSVPEAEVGSLGQNGQAECAAVHAVYPVTVTERNMVANAVTHTYEVTARIEGGTDVLMSGMVAKVQIYGAASQSALVIPASCVLLKQEGYTVWVKENGKAVRRHVEVDGYQADGVRIVSGLAPGDSLITEGYQKLYNGCNVVEDQ